MKNKEQIAKIWNVLDSLNVDVLHNKQAIIKLENEREKPHLKQLDQSVFDGLDEKWRFAAVDECSEAYIYVSEPRAGTAYFVGGSGTDYRLFGQGYDTSNWQNSLIKRETNELTGSDLARAMLARGDRVITCLISNESDDEAIKGGLVHAAIITDAGSLKERFVTLSRNFWSFAVPINNQGEPLTSSDVGL